MSRIRVVSLSIRNISRNAICWICYEVVTCLSLRSILLVECVLIRMVSAVVVGLATRWLGILHERWLL